MIVISLGENVLMSVSLKSVYQQIEQLADESSTNAKIELLRKFLQDRLFSQIVRLAYNQTYSYNVKTFPAFKPAGFHDRGWQHVLPILKELVQRQGADQVIKNKLFQAASIDKETYEITKRICDGDLKCGIGARLINIAVPNTVKIFSYMRCATSKHIDKINFEAGAYGQCKADGSFVNMFVHEDLKIDFRTRNGQDVKCLNFLKARILDQQPIRKYSPRRGLKHLPKHLSDLVGRVYHGELRVMRKDGSIMSRKEGNGIINQCLKGTVDPEIAKRVFFTAWDSVKIDEFYNGYCEIAYQSRFFNCVQLVNVVNNKKFVQLVKNKIVYSKEEAYAYFRQLRSEGEEGEVVKDAKGIWEDNQSGSHHCIKIKHSFSCELEVTGWNYGKEGTKYEHCVGSVICASSCGKLKVNVSGLTDDEREWDWDLMIGVIVTVEAESVIESKSKETFSLYTPSLVEIREDRDSADSLERIIEQHKESKRTRRVKS